MRYIFALLAIVVLTSSSALGIVVDGSTSDWDASLIHSTPNMTSTGGLQINTFGAAVVNGTFYAFMELSRPVSDFDRLYPGAYINVDSSAATELLYNAGSSTTPNYIPISTAAPMLAGTDIILEWGYDARITSPTDKLTYYGLNDHHDGWQKGVRTIFLLQARLETANLSPCLAPCDQLTMDWCIM